MLTCIFTEVIGDIERLVVVTDILKINEAHFLYKKKQKHFHHLQTTKYLIV